ncbi:MAG: class II fructose-bisphosphate aldolase [Candidatus Woesearchaeota archaeon]
MEAKLYSSTPLLSAAEIRSLNGRPAAVGAYNVNFRAQAEGILLGLMDAEAPGIVQASKGACSFNKGPDKVAGLLLQTMNDIGFDGYASLHLDHGNEQVARECIEKGFTSVMYDGSDQHPIANMAKTLEIARLAHQKGISLEAELGQLAGVEEDIAHEKSTYADPRLVPGFVILAGKNILAIAYGTSHGAFKGKTDMVNLQIVGDSYHNLRINQLNENHYLCSHGSSTIPQEAVALINQYGGKLKDTSGMPEAILRQAIRLGIRKINIDTDLRLLMTGYVRKWISENSKRADESGLVSLIKQRLYSEEPIMCVDKKERKGEALSDPRDWLMPVRDTSPDALSGPYQNTNDEAFIEVMQGIKDVVRKHVAYLSAEVFGGKGLAKEVKI